MKLRGPLAAALAAVLLGATRPAPLTVYSAPAANRPAGASRLVPVDAVLADGRTAAPFERAIFVGADPLGVALSPDGRFAVVSNDQRDPAHAGAPPASAPYLRGGYTLAVVDTASMRVTSIYAAKGLALYCGLAVLHDPADPARTIVLASDGPNDAVRVFDLGSNGILTPETKSISVPGFPASITMSPDGRVAYVTSTQGNTVTSIDVANRAVLRTLPVGFAPFGAARAPGALYVADGGLEAYRRLARASAAPSFATVSGSPYKSSALSILPVAENGDLVAPQTESAVRMDPIPDGVDTVGGAHPGSVVVRHDGRFAYVSLSNVDRIATVALTGEPHVVGGLDIRLFINAPYGTQPDAEALDPDGKRLYVALAGLNAVAVLDSSHPAQLHRLGLLPTGAFPSALAISPDGRYLYVTAARGVDGWGLLQRIDLHHLNKAELVRATLSALRYNRDVARAKPNAVVPPLRSNVKSNVIDHVVYIAVGPSTFDGIFGDLGLPDSDSALTSYGESVTPNLHALARAYGVAANFYVDDPSGTLGEQYALGGIATVRAQRMRAGLNDPEAYPRAGYLFNALFRAHMSFRDYGGLLKLTGYQPFAVTPQGRGPKPKPVNVRSLGGVYTLDVPALAALDGHVDLQYPGWSPQITNVQRADEFIRDMGALVAADQEPDYTYVALPSAGGAAMADTDRAVGKIVGFLSRTPHWSSTAVFIVADGAAGTADHINRARSFALVVSPLAKPHYVGHRHLSTASVVKTEEELLGLPPLSLGDLLASDMADFFGDVPYPSTYQPLP